jgi:hypothetical protein
MHINLVNLIMLVSLPTITMAANVALVPQTGQGQTVPTGCTSGCYTSTAGTDGNLQKGVAWPTPRFAVDTAGDCIIDKLTGLMWVRNLNSINGGATLNWTNALNIAESGTWCGYTDWRTPNLNELRSLINYGESDTSIWLNTPISSGGGGFTNVSSASYWTSSLYSNRITVRTVNLSNGTTSNGSTTNPLLQLFPVRGGM